MRHYATILTAMTLALAVGTVIAAPWLYPTRHLVRVPIETVVPSTLDGWTVQTLPIANTETLQASVHKVLQYDAAVFRTYRRRDIQVGIYAAHWKPGKASLSDVGAHTPDTCWIVAGWSRSARAHREGLTVDNRTLLPTEIGRFEKDGAVQHVMFWHLAGGRPIVFDQCGWDVRWPAKIKRGMSFVCDLARFGLNQRCDQCFVRISCNRPLSDLLLEPDFQVLLSKLAPLGIFAPPPI